MHPSVCLYVGTLAQMMFSELLSHSVPYSLFSNLTKNAFCFKIVYKKSGFEWEDVCLVGFMYLVFTHMPHRSYSLCICFVNKKLLQVFCFFF